MIIEWSLSAKDDMVRLYDFIAAVNPKAAEEAVGEVFRFIPLLQGQPRLGRLLSPYEPREVRSSLVGRYEIRYEIKTSKIILLRVWHMREYRETP